jgi:hypothetical protein
VNDRACSLWCQWDFPMQFLDRRESSADRCPARSLLAAAAVAQSQRAKKDENLAGFLWTASASDLADCLEKSLLSQWVQKPHWWRKWKQQSGRDSLGRKRCMARKKGEVGTKEKWGPRESQQRAMRKEREWALLYTFPALTAWSISCSYFWCSLSLGFSFLPLILKSNSWNWQNTQWLWTISSEIVWFLSWIDNSLLSLKSCHVIKKAQYYNFSHLLIENNWMCKVL